MTDNVLELLVCWNKTGNVRTNVTMRCVLVTFVAVERDEYYIF